MSAHAATARQCIELAAAAAPAMVGRAIDQAVAAMQEEEQRSKSVAQRQELADAWLELLRRRADWSQRFASQLAVAQAAAPDTESHAPAAQPSDDRFGGLSLVDEDALAKTIEGSRLLQLLAPKLEQPLAELDGLMSSALGLATVHPERNPLRPQVFAQSLRELMNPVAQPAWPKLWSQHLAAPMATEIATLYKGALDILRQAKLEAATYRVLPTASNASPAAKPLAKPAAVPAPTGPGAGPGVQPAQGRAGGPGQDGTHAAAMSAAAAPSGAAATSATATSAPATSAPAAPQQPGGSPTEAALGGAVWADLTSYPLGDELFQQFLFSRSRPSTQALAPAYYAKVDSQLAALQAAPADTFEPYDAEAVLQHRALPPVERPHRPASTTRELDSVWGRWAPARERSLHRSRLKKEAREVGQVLGLEVVRKLVDQVASDPRLLAPVREAIVALEPALLRLALVAPRFFSQEEHAGRRLVERVAERSFRYNDEFAADFQEFFADVRMVFQALNEQKIADEAPFAQVLAELEERWTGEDLLAERGRQVAADALHFAEAREAQAAQIAWSLSQRSDLEGVPVVVQDFLYGPWSLVMAHARLTDAQHQVDPGGWNGVISDLLWSVKPEQTLRDPARLIATIPRMLERVRGGLELIGQAPGTHETFFAALENLHRPVLKLRARQRKAGPAPDASPRVDAALLSRERHQPSAPTGDPWLTPSELKAAGFEHSTASAPAPLQATPQDVDAAAVIADLHQGCWVDLHVNDSWRRASLSWVSNRSTLFMFVSHGGQPHTMTRRSLERLVRERLLRPVDAGAVVPRAIETLSKPHDSASPADAATKTTLRPAREDPVAA